MPVPGHRARWARRAWGDGDRVLGVRSDGGRGVRTAPGGRARSLARGAHRRSTPAGHDPGRGGEHRDRRGRAASSPGVRGLPLRDRRRETADPRVEEGAAGGRDRSVGRPVRPSHRPPVRPSVPCLTSSTTCCNAALRAAGLQRVTVSLDTLRPERMRAFAKSARHADVLDGIAAARQAGFAKLKLNAVVIRGFNDDELVDLIEFARGHEAEVRFIEYMDVGGATRWSQDQVVSQREMLEVLAGCYGAIEPVAADGRAPAERFRLADGTTFGIIASVTAPFCRTCDRSRVTADGTWFLCLYAARGIDLREPLRRGATDDDLASRIRDTWQGRTDRGAEERLGVADRGALYRIDSLRADPHREMHTRGG